MAKMSVPGSPSTVHEKDQSPSPWKGTESPSRLRDSPRRLRDSPRRLRDSSQRETVMSVASGSKLAKMQSKDSSERVTPEPDRIPNVATGIGGQASQQSPSTATYKLGSTRAGGASQRKAAGLQGLI